MIAPSMAALMVICAAGKKQLTEVYVEHKDHTPAVGAMVYLKRLAPSPPGVTATLDEDKKRPGWYTTTDIAEGTTFVLWGVQAPSVHAGFPPVVDGDIAQYSPKMKMPPIRIDGNVQIQLPPGDLSVSNACGPGWVQPAWCCTPCPNYAITPCSPTYCYPQCWDASAPPGSYVSAESASRPRAVAARSTGKSQASPATNSERLINNRCPVIVPIDLPAIPIARESRHAYGHVVAQRFIDGFTPARIRIPVENPRSTIPCGSVAASR